MFGAKKRQKARRSPLVLFEQLEQRLLLSASYTTSWLGNTFGGTPNGMHVQQDIQAIDVTPSGVVYATSAYDESGANSEIFQNGAIIGQLQTPQFGMGTAIAMNGTYVFVAQGQASGGAVNGVARYNLNGTPANFSSGGNQVTINSAGIGGMAISGSTLYVTDIGNNVVRAFNVSTMAEQTANEWSVTAPGQIAVDASGNVWVTVTSNNTVVEYSPTGTALQTISGIGQPGPLAFDNNGRLMVADNGPNENVRIYTISGTTHTLYGTFGSTGGIYAGTEGRVGAGRFHDITGIGCDAAGNYYIAMDGSVENRVGGTELVAFNGGNASSVAWSLYGLEFVSGASADPLDPNIVYTPTHEYTLNYSNPAGQQWSYTANTLDTRAFPNDLRVSPNILDGGQNNFSSPIIREVKDSNGIYHKIMFLVDQIGQNLAWWTFNSTYGDVAVPSGELFVPQSSGDVGPYPGIQPAASTPYIWTNTAGNGTVTSSEFATLANDPWAGAQIYPAAFTVDANGGLWVSGQINGGIRYFPLQGFDSHGNPIYTFASMKSYTFPAPFYNTTNSGQMVERLFYQASTDTLFVAGFTTAVPPDNYGANNNGNTFKVLAAYTGWVNGSQSLAWSITLPTDATTTYTNSMPKGFTVSGNYLFVDYYVPHQVLVYNTSNGSLVATLTPGADVGGASNVGNVDTNNPITAIQQSNGTYLIFGEEDGKAKVLLYLWNPTTALPVVPTGLTASTVSSSQINLSWSAVAGATGYNVYRGTTSGGENYSAPINGSTPLTTTSYSDTGLSASTAYYYTVDAVNSAGTSAAGNEAAANTQPAILFFNVNFSNDTVGSVPATSPFVTGSTDTSPTYVGSSGGYTATVESGVGGLTGHPVQLQTANDGASGNPALQFGMPGTSSGTVDISWQSEMTAYTPPTGGANTEVDLTFRLLNGNGQLFGGVGYAYNSANTSGTVYGGGIQQVGDASASYASGANDSWSVNGGVDQFNMQVNLSSGTFALSRNGSSVMTGNLGANYNTGGGLAYFQIQSGSGISGSDGQYTAGVDNFTIGTTPAPTAPTGLTATAASSSQINLSWSGATGATGYNVYRGTTSGGENYSAPINGSTPLTTTSYFDTGLSAGTAYYYTVEAVNSGGSSAAGNQATATTSAGTIYQDNFAAASGTALNGQTVASSASYAGGTAGATWIAGTPDVTETGSNAVSLGSGSGNNEAYLPFAAKSGYIYTLSASLTGATSGWTALGFTEGPAAIGNGAFVYNSNTVAWGLVNPPGAEPQFFQGPSTGGGNGSFGTTSDSGTQTLVITLNTTGAQWVASAAIGGDKSATYTYTSGNPTITYVGFGGARPAGSGGAVADFALTATAAAVPVAPTNLAATAASNSQINLSWSAAAGATGYNVYRGTTSGGENYSAPINGSTPLTTTSYSDFKGPHPRSRGGKHRVVDNWMPVSGHSGVVRPSHTDGKRRRFVSFLITSQVGHPISAVKFFRLVRSAPSGVQ